MVIRLPPARLALHIPVSDDLGVSDSILCGLVRCRLLLPCLTTLTYVLKFFHPVKIVNPLSENED
jgi:hypothetical protein